MILMSLMMMMMTMMVTTVITMNFLNFATIIPMVVVISGSIEDDHCYLASLLSLLPSLWNMRTATDSPTKKSRAPNVKAPQCCDAGWAAENLILSLVFDPCLILSRSN